MAMVGLLEDARGGYYPRFTLVGVSAPKAADSLSPTPNYAN